MDVAQFTIINVFSYSEILTHQPTQPRVDVPLDVTLDFI